MLTSTFSSTECFSRLFTICVPSLVGWLFEFSFAHFSKQAFKTIVVKCTWHKIYHCSSF